MTTQYEILQDFTYKVTQEPMSTEVLQEIELKKGDTTVLIADWDFTGLFSAGLISKGEPYARDRQARPAETAKVEAASLPVEVPVAQLEAAAEEDVYEEPPLKGRLRVAGFDTTRTYAAGEVYDKDNRWLRRMLVNGLAEPLDDATRAILGKKWFIDLHRIPTLVEKARQAGISDANIPAVAQGE